VFLYLNVASALCTIHTIRVRLVVCSLEYRMLSRNFVPDRCPNQGCNKLFAKKDLQRHIAECEFGIAQWKSSEKYLKHKDEKVFYYQQ